MQKFLLLCTASLLFVTACASNEIKVTRDDITNKSYLTYLKDGTAEESYIMYEFKFIREIDAKSDISYIKVTCHTGMDSDPLKEDAVVKCGQTVLNIKIAGMKSSVRNWQSESKESSNRNLIVDNEAVGTILTTTSSITNHQSRAYSFQIQMTPELKNALTKNPDAAFRFYASTDPITIRFKSDELKKISDLLIKSPSEIEAALIKKKQEAAVAAKYNVKM